MTQQSNLKCQSRATSRVFTLPINQQKQPQQWKIASSDCFSLTTWRHARLVSREMRRFRRHVPFAVMKTMDALQSKVLFEICFVSSQIVWNCDTFSYFFTSTVPPDDEQAFQCWQLSLCVFLGTTNFDGIKSNRRYIKEQPASLNPE